MKAMSVEHPNAIERRKIQNRLAQARSMAERAKKKSLPQGEDQDLSRPRAVAPDVRPSPEAADDLASWDAPGYVSEEIPWLWPPTAVHENVEDGETSDVEASDIAFPSTDLYQTLDGPNAIRILEIEPGDGPIVTKLRSASLDDRSLDFEALSYVWGARAARTIITCNGTSTPIRSNLAAALQRVRLPTASRLIWVDALCINQQDASERGHQVRLMRQIYMRATEVLVWLGEDPAGMAAPAFALACRLTNGPLLGAHSEARYTRPDGSTHPGPAGRLPPASSAAWAPLAALFARRWFWRLWVVQEIVLAPSAAVLWGGARVDWRWIASAAARLRNVHFPVVQAHRMYGVFNAYFMHRMSLGADPDGPLRLSFLRLLTLTRQFEVSDPRDRIYGLLGLTTMDAAPERGELFVEPDYGVGAQELYCKIARQVLQGDKSLRLLSAVQHGPSIPTAVPSWVPRWESAYTHMLMPSDPDMKFAASGGSSLAELSIDGSYTLTLKGVRAKRVARTIPLAIDGEQISATLLDAPEVQSCASCSQGIEMLAATLTAGKDWYGALVDDPVGHALDFRAWLAQNSSNEAVRQILEAGEAEPLRLSQEDPDARRFIEAASYACNGRTLFVTVDGTLGLGPAATREGDDVCIFLGGTVPYIVRTVGDSSLFAGECYVKDLMNGKALTDPAMGTGHIEDLKLS